MRRRSWTLLSSLFVLALLTGATGAQAAGKFPALIDLPNGWLPEGVVTGHGPVIYSGSRANGAIYAANLRTGAGQIVVAGMQGRVAVGLSFDKRSNYIFAAGGATGKAFVYDPTSGATEGEYTLTNATATFVNDVIVTREAAYFTDSQQPVIYRLPLGPGGRLPAADAIETIPLSGDFQQVPGFNANGIEATPNGESLIIVNSTLGLLYKVDPTSGVTSEIDLGGASVSNGDGILLQGRTLYVVRNRLNEIAVVKLAKNLLSGTVVDTITDPNFDVPTTVAAFGNRLYAVNARFSTPPTAETEYSIVQVRR